MEIWAKRDDVSRLGLGGNKIRKLDLILGAALRDGVDTVITVGGVQSNHCRLTAAATARLGLRCVVHLLGAPDTQVAGNLLLDHMFGAEVHLHDAEAFSELDAHIEMSAAAERSAGRQPLVIPLGASNPLGGAAYAMAAFELAEQCAGAGIRPSAVVLPAGTGGTLAGATVGMAAALPETRVIGVSVSREAGVLYGDVVAQFEGIARAAGLPTPDHGPEITDAFIGGGYTEATGGGAQAVRTLARNEGVLSDLTYTGKAMDALLTYVPTLGLTDPVIFWHTGGAPELFARAPGLLLDGKIWDHEAHLVGAPEGE